MKKIFLFYVILCSTLTLAQTPLKRIGVFNLKFALEHLARDKALTKLIKTVDEKDGSKIESLKQEIIKDYQNLPKLKQIMSKENLTKFKQRLKQKENRINELSDKYNNKIMKIKQPYIKKIISKIKSIAKKAKINIVFDSSVPILFFDGQLSDITEEVMKGYSNENH